MSEIISKLKIKSSGISGAVPIPSFLDVGELAINYVDGIIFYKDANNIIHQFSGTDPSSAPIVRSFAEGPPHGRFASVIPVIAGPNTGMLVTAKVAGQDGNDIRIKISTSADIAVYVSGDSIECEIDDGITTMVEIIDAINNHFVANLMVGCQIAEGSDGTGIAIPTLWTNLTGGLDAVIANRIGQDCIMGDAGGPFRTFKACYLEPTVWQETTAGTIIDRIDNSVQTIFVHETDRTIQTEPI